MLVGPGAGAGAGVVDGAGSRVWLAETRSAGAGAKAQLAGAPACARTSARFCSILAASSEVRSEEQWGTELAAGLP